MALTLITSETTDVRRREPRTYSGSFDPGETFTFFEDWFTAAPSASANLIGNMSWAWDANGGNIISVAGETSAPGIIQIDTGNNSSGRASVYQSLDSVLLGGAELTMQARVRVNALSTGAQAYTAQVGLGDSIAATDSADGVYFQHNQTTGTWQCVTRNNSVETLVNTTVSITANTWYTLRFVVDSVAGSVKFYVGTNSSNVVLVATISTNIPKTTGRNTGALIKIRKTVGSNLRYLHNDYYLIAIAFGSAR